MTLNPLGKTARTEASGLEALFLQDMSPGMSNPAKLSPKVAAALIEKGFAEEFTEQVGRDAFGPVVVSGHRITMRGHMHYCEMHGGEEVAE